jgi:hypothetical protein
MATISKPHTFSPNTTASSSQVNADFDTIYNDYNGSINASNLATGAVSTAKIADDAVTTAKILDANVTNAKLAHNVAWTTYTPTFVNFTIGNGTITYARYQQIGKTVRVSLLVTLGSTSVMGTTPTISLPVTSASHYVADREYLGLCALADTGTTEYIAMATWASTTTIKMFVGVANATYLSTANITATVPFTWTTNDRFSADFTYEAA